ncbi:hypothetical protein [Mycolicibacterium sphagni]|uniref:hypothetical protein n=1 Tax=Mycolicibacterium sphagni TaxID=1786 RepID=UPI0021F322FA|nr:hypothetical protein [Mycolicibacterium sphagni]MCV7174810.1 hypothetical protein [Mycolicibacterium sphagni]
MTPSELARVELQVTIASVYGFLLWGSEDWPQPHPVLACGMPAWDWDAIAGAVAAS